MRNSRWIMAIAASLAVSSASADVTWKLDDWNPKPAEGDVVLPMPCGGAMAFRRVVTGTPGGDPMADRPIVLGWASQLTAYIDYLRGDYLSGAFDDAATGERFYLIAKYETTAEQFAAVNDPQGCALPAGDQAGVAKGDVGWFDAVDFSRRYTAWLLANAPEALKAAGGEGAFVRLPAETEWEFAAGGGVAVTDAERTDRMPSIEGGMAGYAWSSGAESRGEIQPIGILQPNPLGLYDMLGNVDEIVIELFRMNRAGRLQGQVGGYTVRGGSVLTPRDDLRTQIRQEVPFFAAGGETRGRATGFRVVVGASALGGLERATQLQQRWKEIRDGLAGAGVGNPSGALESLIAEEADPARREILSSTVEAYNKELTLRKEAAERAAKNLIFSAALLRGELAKNAAATASLRKLVEAVRGDADLEKKYADAIAVNEKLFAFYAANYADVIAQLARDYPEDVLVRQGDTLILELRGRGEGGGEDDVSQMVKPMLAQVAAYRSGAVTETSAIVKEVISGR